MLFEEKNKNQNSLRYLFDFSTIEHSNSIESYFEELISHFKIFVTSCNLPSLKFVYTMESRDA